MLHLRSITHYNVWKNSRFLSIKRIAIVGTGPSGFYSAKYLLEQDEQICVDMYDALPTPFGLVRYGVAPDHPEVKSVTATFTDVATSPRFRYFGNITIGDTNGKETISVFDMMRAYSGVILAHGASSDNQLDITGKHLKGIHSARQFVNWYNAHPDHVTVANDAAFDLSQVKDVVVIGQGNVALDCARILSKDVDQLASTDISCKAESALRNSNVQSVTVLGRRGHVQSAFTIKEFRELTKLKGVQLKVTSADMAAGLTDASKAELENNRPKKRIVELIQSVATAEALAGADKRIDVRFLLTPFEFVGDANGRVSGLKVLRNRLEGEPNKQHAVAVDGEPETIPCQLVLQSIGYKCQPISDRLPFDHRSNTMPHSQGRVIVNSQSSNLNKLSTISVENGGKSALAVKGLYVAGWLKRGPTGIVGSNINDAKETVAALLADARSGILEDSDSDSADALLSAAGCARGEGEVVDWRGHLRIDAEELLRGSARSPPKEREKLLSRDEMLHVALVR